MHSLIFSDFNSLHSRDNSFINAATVYYLPGTSGWGSTYAGRPARLWNPVASNVAAPSSVTPFSFAITGTPGIPVAIEARPTLSTGVWERVLTTRIPSGGVLEFTDAADTISDSARYYRVVAP